MDFKNLIFALLMMLVGVFLLISLYLYRKEQKIKDTKKDKTNGKVIRYSFNESRAPVVVYRVNGNDYKKALRYTYVSHLSTPLSDPKTTLRSDILDTKLKLRRNNRVSINTIMNDNFPIGSYLDVYYSSEDPKIAYVQRYAPSLIWVIFLISGRVIALTAIILLMNL